MGYVVRWLGNSKRPFKVQFVAFEGTKSKTRDVPENEWSQLGFSDSMSLEDARKRRDQLNAQVRQNYHENRRHLIQERLAAEAEVHDAFLSAKDVAEFERKVLFHEFSDLTFARRNRVNAHWRMARRAIVALKIDPSEFFMHRKKVYDWFSKQTLSLSYLQKTIRMMNLWGEWHCQKYKRFYKAIPNPSGHEREKVADKYFDAHASGKASDPLTPEMLERAKDHLKGEDYRWLSISVWFGLRPKEIDSILKQPTSWKIEQHQGKLVLFVYQTKLTAVPRDKRWKPIPAIYPEQVKAISYVRAGQFKRPLGKVVKHHFGPRITLYGGRKAFTDLMLSRGQKLENIATWLGHTTIDRTWKSYKDRQKIAFDPAET